MLLKNGSLGPGAHEEKVVIKTFLSWPEHRVQDALAQLGLIENKQIPSLRGSSLDLNAQAAQSLLLKKNMVGPRDHGKDIIR